MVCMNYSYQIHLLGVSTQKKVCPIGPHGERSLEQPSPQYSPSVVSSQLHAEESLNVLSWVPKEPICSHREEKNLTDSIISIQNFQGHVCISCTQTDLSHIDADPGNEERTHSLIRESMAPSPPPRGRRESYYRGRWSAGPKERGGGRVLLDTDRPK